MKRRDFIERTGLLAGGLLLGSSWRAAAPAGPVRVGIIGCGDRGRGILSVLAQLKEQFTLTAICDILDFRLETTQKEPSRFFRKNLQGLSSVTGR
jgi:predicted homoserine dehydrogenase-like protein